MKTNNAVKLLIKHGFELIISETVPDELDPLDKSLDLHMDTYAKGGETINLTYDAFELLSTEYINADGREFLIKSEKGLRDILMD